MKLSFRNIAAFLCAFAFVLAAWTAFSEAPSRLFFMHFWGLDEPAKVAEGLNAALSRVAVQ